ncbi:MAG: hypothetical protein IT473_12570 [Lysobacter sp.]|nr:hypothetical protein [Lysobacter sp.]
MRLLKSAALAFALAASIGHAQTFSFEWNPRSGDPWVDVWLGDMNRYGSRYRDPFVDELVRYHGAPRELVEELLGRRWAPGDLYFACALARATGHSCRYTTDLWERDHGQGWGALAKRLGIKPGSPEFLGLKRGMVPTYDRWGRPIDLDAQLQRDFPGRGKGAGQHREHYDDHGPERGGKGRSDHGPGNSHGKGKD